MPRVVGIDPGTISIDVCGLDDGQVVLDRAWPTAEALADVDGFVGYLRSAGEPSLVAGLSGYGLPLVPANRATDDDWRLAFLAGPGNEGGIGGLRRLTRSLCAAQLPLLFLPGVVHLDTVPAHRKLNRVDLGTADKLSVTALAITEQAERLDLPVSERRWCCSSWVARSARLRRSRTGGLWTGSAAPAARWVVCGGSPGRRGRLPGGHGRQGPALSGRGGVHRLGAPRSRTSGTGGLHRGAVKAVHQMLLSAPGAREIVVSGRRAADPRVHDRIGASSRARRAGRPVAGVRSSRQARRPGGRPHRRWTGRWATPGPGGDTPASARGGKRSGPPLRGKRGGRTRPSGVGFAWLREVTPC